jgi:hypothetical protein
VEFGVCPTSGRASMLTMLAWLTLQKI